MGSGTPESSEENLDSPPPGAGPRTFFEGLLEEAQEFTRRRPLEGLLISLIAGMVLSDLLRRKP